MTKTISNLCVVWLFAAFATSLIAQDNVKPESPAATDAGVAGAVQAKLSETYPTVAEVDAKIAQISAAKDLGEPAIAAAKETLQQAKLDLVAAENSTAKAAAYQKDAAAVPDKLIAAKKELENKTVDDEPNTRLSLAELKLEYDSVETERTAASQQSPAQNRQSRAKEIPDRILEAEEKLTEVNAQIDKLADDADAALVVEARRMSLQAERFRFRSEIASLEAERKFYSTAVELLSLQNELFQRKKERLQQKSALLKAAVEAKRETEIDKLKRLVDEQEKATPEIIKREAAVNAELVRQFDNYSKRLAVVGSDTEKVRQALEEVDSEYKTSIDRVEAVGLNETIGLMFRRNRSTLAARRRNFQPDGTLQAEIRKLQIETFRLDDLSKNAPETEASISHLFDANNVPDINRPLKPGEDSQRKSLRPAVVKLLSQRREILGQLRPTQDDLYNKVSKLYVDKKKVVTEIDEYTNYINEHVLWIRSGAMVGPGDVQSFPKALQWISLPSNWTALGQTLVEAVKKKFGLSVLLFSSIILAISWAASVTQGHRVSRS